MWPPYPSSCINPFFPAPPEAPVTGYFLGKGAYFADMVSVSGQYLKTSNQHPVGFMLLCDVALGRTFQLAHGKFIGKDDLDSAGFHSVKVNINLNLFKPLILFFSSVVELLVLILAMIPRPMMVLLFPLDVKVPLVFLYLN